MELTINEARENIVLLHTDLKDALRWNRPWMAFDLFERCNKAMKRAEQGITQRELDGLNSISCELTDCLKHVFEDADWRHPYKDWPPPTDREIANLFRDDPHPFAQKYATLYEQEMAPFVEFKRQARPLLEDCDRLTFETVKAKMSVPTGSHSVEHDNMNGWERTIGKYLLTGQYQAAIELIERERGDWRMVHLHTLMRVAFCDRAIVSALLRWFDTAREACKGEYDNVTFMDFHVLGRFFGHHDEVESLMVERRKTGQEQLFDLFTLRDEVLDTRAEFHEWFETFDRVTDLVESHQHALNARIPEIQKELDYEKQGLFRSTTVLEMGIENLEVLEQQIRGDLGLPTVNPIMESIRRWRELDPLFALRKIERAWEDGPLNRDERLEVFQHALALVEAHDFELLAPWWRQEASHYKGTFHFRPPEVLEQISNLEALVMLAQALRCFDELEKLLADGVASGDVDRNLLRLCLDIHADEEQNARMVRALSLDKPS